MSALLIIAGMALVTFLTRYTMVALLGREIPPLLSGWLRYVPIAVLSALVAPAAIAPQGRPTAGIALWASLAGAIVAWRTRNVVWTIIAGLLVFWLLRLIVTIQ
jgi:branched-subunit amino acid transport protein